MYDCITVQLHLDVLFGRMHRAMRDKSKQTLDLKSKIDEKNQQIGPNGESSCIWESQTCGFSASNLDHAGQDPWTSQDGVLTISINQFHLQNWSWHQCILTF